MTGRFLYYHEENIVNLIDQLDVEFSGALNDICVSKAEVIAAVTEYFESEARKGNCVGDGRDREAWILHRKLETYD